MEKLTVAIAEDNELMLGLLEDIVANDKELNVIGTARNGEDIYKIIKESKKTTIMVTHDISEAISMSDKVVVLSKRPACVKSIHEIDLVTEGEKTPLKTRKVPQFQYYFDILWKELDSYEIKQ